MLVSLERGGRRKQKRSRRSGEEGREKVESVRLEPVPGKEREDLKGEEWRQLFQNWEHHGFFKTFFRHSTLLSS